MVSGLTIMAIAFGAASIVAAVSYGISKITCKAVESIARQPEAAEAIGSTSSIPTMLIEGAGMFGLVICGLLAIRLAA